MKNFPQGFIQPTSTNFIQRQEQYGHAWVETYTAGLYLRIADNNIWGCSALNDNISYDNELTENVFTYTTATRTYIKLCKQENSVKQLGTDIATTVGTCKNDSRTTTLKIILTIILK